MQEKLLPYTKEDLTEAYSYLQGLEKSLDVEDMIKNLTLVFSTLTFLPAIRINIVFPL